MSIAIELSELTDWDNLLTKLKVKTEWLKWVKQLCYWIKLARVTELIVNE